MYESLHIEKLLRIVDFGKSYYNFIEGFLIGTKRNANGWQVSKQTLPQIVNGFIGKPFTIIPQKLEHNIDAHFHGATKQETIDGYANYKHGTIEKVIGPIPYNDGTSDFYYKHITRLSNSKSASLLHHYGSLTKRPFAVSPHIWHEDVNITDYVQNFTPIGISLVADGAYGDIAVINKMCQGTAETCHRSLGACKGDKNCLCCENTDENIANILSSHFSKSASVPTIMSINSDITNTTPSAVTTPPINNTNTPTQQQQQLTQEPTASDKIVLTKEQYDLIQQERKEFESTKSRLTILEDTHKTSVLNGIFTADLITDETTRNNLVDKWKKFDVVMVQDLYQDFTASLVPALIEKARKDAETAAALATAANAATAGTPAPTNKSKSASLKPEPKVSEEDKAAAITEPVKINEVALLRKYLFSGGKP